MPYPPEPPSDPLPDHLLRALMPLLGGEVIVIVQVGDCGPAGLFRGVLDRVVTRDLSKAAAIHMDELAQGNKIVVPALHLIAVEPDPFDPLALRLEYVSGSVTIKDSRPEARVEQYRREITHARRFKDPQERRGRLRVLDARLQSEAADADEPLRSQLERFRVQIEMTLRYEREEFLPPDLDTPEPEDVDDDWEW